MHQTPKTEQLIKARDAILPFLPHYSPDLMPIEKNFGTLKRQSQNYPDLSRDQFINMFFYFLKLL